jgi:hypothetical protein
MEFVRDFAHENSRERRRKQRRPGSLLVPRGTDLPEPGIRSCRWCLSSTPSLFVQRGFPRQFKIAPHEFSKRVLVRVSDYPSDALQPRNFIRGALGIAACHDDPTPGIHPVQATDELACFSVCRCGDRASIDDRELALLGARALRKTSLKQLLLEGGTIGLAGPATKIDKVKRHHQVLSIIVVYGSISANKPS